MKTLLLTLGLVGVMLAQQNGTPVQVVPYPRDEPTKFLDYDTSNNLIYVCYAAAKGPWNNNSVPATFSWLRSDSTLTSIVVLTNVGTVTTSTAHGLQIGNPVTITGATVDTDLNGTNYYVATIPSTTTFTFATSAVANATYNESTLAIATTAPRLTANIWNILKMTYSTANNLTDVQWANGTASSLNICTNRAVLTGATRILYR